MRLAEEKSHPKHKLAGQKFGRLTVKWFAGSRRVGASKSARRFWLCQCDCGQELEVRTDQLTHGVAKSCGCLQREIAAKFAAVTGRANLKHGHANPLRKSIEYIAWQGMKQRCYDPNYHHYKDYGARGITVCQRWLDSFEAFYADMGPKPSPQHSLDRKNNNGNYNKHNCRWATSKEQANNRRPK